MRILHVYKAYFPESQGGVEEAIRQICEATGELGAENRILTLAPRGSQSKLARAEATVVRYRRNFSIASCDVSLAALRAFRGEAAAADLVHYHFPWPFADLMHIMGGVRAPTVLTYHSDVVRQRNLMRFYNPLMWRFVKDMTRVVATSPNYLTTSPVLQSVSDRVDIIPIGVDESNYPASTQSLLDSVRNEVGEGFFLFVGVLRYYKGLHVLLDAATGTNLPVVIAGAGPVEEELRDRADELGLNNVTFLGQVTDRFKAALLQLCRGVVFPSHMRSEAFGVSLVEGAMFGRPLISAEIGTGTTYVNSHEQSGIVVRPGDVDQLRAAMQRLYADDGLASRLGAGARARYEALFTGAQMGSSYNAVYQELLGS